MAKINSQIKQQDLPHFNQKIIECDLTMFTRLLNDLVDRVNLNHKYVVAIYDTVTDLKQRVECLETQVEDHERRISAIEKIIGDFGGDFGDLENQINNINTSLTNINKNISDLSSELAWYNSHLPVTKEVVDTKAMKLAVGNINVLSANGGTPSMDTGVITSESFEDNDIYFN